MPASPPLSEGVRIQARGPEGVDALSARLLPFRLPLTARRSSRAHRLCCLEATSSVCCTGAAAARARTSRHGTRRRTSTCGRQRFAAVPAPPARLSQPFTRSLRYGRGREGGAWFGGGVPASRARDDGGRASRWRRECLNRRGACLALGSIARASTRRRRSSVPSLTGCKELCCPLRSLGSTARLSCSCTRGGCERRLFTPPAVNRPDRQARLVRTRQRNGRAVVAAP